MVENMIFPARIVNNHLVVRTSNPEAIRKIFPTVKEAIIKGQNFCAVPFSLETARILNNMGIPAPSPIRTHYAWPGVYRPMKHQIHTADFLTVNTRNFLLSGMGSGKTLSALWAADYLQQTKQIKKVLVVAPLSTLDPTWGNEIFKNFPLKKFAILHGSRQKRLDLLASEQDIYVINHDGVEVIYDELIMREDIDLFVLDELAVYRGGTKTKRWKTMNALLNKCGFARAAWGLTGAPTPNEPTDAFAQMKLIRPENYKGHFTSFKNETMHQITQFKWIPRKGAEKTVNKILKPSIRYALADCVDLPRTIYSERRVALSAEQNKHYRELLNRAMTEIRGSTVTAVNAAVLVSKILQAACGAIYSADGALLKLDAKPRLAIVEELIEECRQKVLVFVPFTGALNHVAEKLSKKWSVGVIDGSVSVNKRNQIFQNFRQTTHPHVIVANAAAMSHGLTLTEASKIIWFAPAFSNDVYNQANARIVRPGQKHVTQIVHIYATAEERKIYNVLKEKGRMQDAVLELAEIDEQK
jgi:SNF2 family DNA or RNA helicase